MNATEVKAEQAAYWRFTRQMPVVAVEALDEDVLVVSKSRQLFVIEVKIGIADMRQDRLKPKHADIRKVLGLPLLEKQHSWYSDPVKYGRVPNYFYFAVPVEILDKAAKVRDELYPYAGLIVTKMPYGKFLGKSSEVFRKADQIHKNKLGLKAISHIVKAQSASLANIYGHFAALRRRLDGTSLRKSEGVPAPETQLFGRFDI